jgi:hypothetical protein
MLSTTQGGYWNTIFAVSTLVVQDLCVPVRQIPKCAGEGEKESESQEFSSRGTGRIYNDRVVPHGHSVKST